jgi:hypothetical protein
VQVAIVQLVFLDDVMVEAVECLIRQELAREEARPAQAFEAATRRASARLAFRFSGRTRDDSVS